MPFLPDKKYEVSYEKNNITYTAKSRTTRSRLTLLDMSDTGVFVRATYYTHEGKESVTTAHGRWDDEFEYILRRNTRIKSARRMLFAPRSSALGNNAQDKIYTTTFHVTTSPRPHGFLFVGSPFAVTHTRSAQCTCTDHIHTYTHTRVVVRFMHSPVFTNPSLRDARQRQYPR